MEATRIMVAVNESTIKGYPNPSISSSGAFEWALDKIVRHNTSAFKLLFLHVQVPDQDDDFRRLNRRDKIRGLHLLEYFVDKCHALGISCEAWIKKGDAKEVICHEVNRVKPDILVVGSRGLGPFQKVFVGAVSDFCVKHCECPVITIKRKANEAPQDPIQD